MDKNSLLYQLMALRMNSVMNDVAERDEDYPRSAPGGANRARGLAKATRPLTCTHFDPASHPRFPLHFGLPCTPCQHG